MYREATNRPPTMKSERKSGFDRFFNKRRQEKAAQPRDRADERKEALVLLAIAVLFLANVVLYLCHHYGLTSLNDSRPRSEMSARVILD
jgi:hypothetical protein